MGPRARRQRDRHAVRTLILDAARELFVTDAYEAVTMRRIAEAIDYSPTAIYLHFKDKETLFRELCKTDSFALAEAFQSIATEPDPLVRLRRIGLAYVEFGTSHPNHYRLMFLGSHRLDREALPDMGHGDPERDGYAFLIGALQEAIAQGRLRLGLTDADLIAQAYWASIHGALALHLTRAGDPWVDWRSLNDTAALVIDAMLLGLSSEEAECS
jgi:AcrR family transcriptional regulator